MADQAGPRLARSAAASSAAGGAGNRDEIERLDVVEERLQQPAAERNQHQAARARQSPPSQAVGEHHAPQAARGWRRAPRGCSAPCAAAGRCRRAGRRCRPPTAPARAAANAWNSQSAKRRDGERRRGAAVERADVGERQVGIDGVHRRGHRRGERRRRRRPTLRTAKNTGRNSIWPSGNQSAGLTSGSAGKSLMPPTTPTISPLGAEDAARVAPTRIAARKVAARQRVVDDQRERLAHRVARAIEERARATSRIPAASK